MPKTLRESAASTRSPLIPLFMALLFMALLFMALVGRTTERLNQRQFAALARLGQHLLELVAGLAFLSSLVLETAPPPAGTRRITPEHDRGTSDRSGPRDTGVLPP